MNVSAEDLPFLRDLVKASRQRVHHLNWVDRDGTRRLTTLTEPEFTRLKSVASGLKLPPAEVLRQAAYIPKDGRQGTDGGGRRTENPEP